MASTRVIEVNAVDRLVGRSSIRTLYQPIVDLDSGTTVAFEALARGPVGHRLERPDALFAAAAAAGCTRELDRACQSAALSGAVAARLAGPRMLFINIEPAHAEATVVDLAPHSGAAAGAGFPVIVEITERALTTDPVELIRMVERVRAHGWGIAIDDVGADPASLAFLPLLRPDVVKLDLRLVQDHPTDAVARIFNAVHAERERSGAVILAEGIETERHLDAARAFGATLGQGWLLGHPAPLPADLPMLEAQHVPLRIADESSGWLHRSAFDLVAAVRSPRVGRKDLLIEISKQFENQAIQVGETALVVAALQDAEFLTPATTRRYEALAQTGAFVGLVGNGLTPHPVRRVRGGHLAPADPLTHEWDVAVLGPHFSGALVARDLGDTGPDRDRHFEFVVTHDRDLTVMATQAILARIDKSA